MDDIKSDHKSWENSETHQINLNKLHSDSCVVQGVENLKTFV